MAEPDREPPRIGVVFTGLVLVMLLAALDSTIVATALPTIVGELGGLDDRADRVPGRAGARRRRADRAHPGDDRRHRAAARARALPGHLRRRVRALQRGRAAARRGDRRARLLALGVLRQPADRP